MKLGQKKEARLDFQTTLQQVPEMKKDQERKSGAVLINAQSMEIDPHHSMLSSIHTFSPIRSEGTSW
jgi:hypothetical protein